MKASRRIWLFTLAGLCAASASGIAGQILGSRIVVGTGVVCREQPNRTAPPVHSYRVGDVVTVARAILEANEIWFFDQSRVTTAKPSCWVFGPMTADYDSARPEQGLFAVVEHILLRKDTVEFQEYVSVENLLLAADDGRALESSGLLQFQRLELVARAARRGEDTWIFDGGNALARAWVMSHRDLLADDSVDGWYPRSAPYWQLYERFKQETWADELAWAASQRTRPTDECYSHCVLQVHLIDGPLQYWVRRPQGTRVNQALARAVDLAAYAASMACYDRRAPSQSQSPVPADLLRRIRASLSDVTASGKQQLLSHLADAEKRCGGRG